MASVLGTSSTASFASQLVSSPSSKPAFPSLSLIPGQSYGKKFYGGIGIHGKKGRSQFRVAVTNVATETNSVEQAQKLASKKSQRPVYPFAAIVGQDEMKLCLLLNVIDPKIGGVMIMGDRGTGKSTTVRSLVDLLPEIKVVSGDPYNSDPADPESMGNPEEGELRPQLLDRFGMHAQVGTVKDADLRVKIVEERARFDKNQKEFRDSYKAEQEKLRSQIASARSSLSSVQIDRDLKVKISKVCSELNVDGLRGDIVTNRAAKALAALKGKDKVAAEDIATVIPNCLRHRLRKDPLESIDSGLLVIEKFYDVFS
ncbi:Magnesium-chelatase subunit chlI chloroplastic [Tripterygium wilfordii]|uniref:magnesium chelatase n=1 Tax=Tripterygium wilfordii TaxID=458696 RepID=A0A7J7C4V5_TRIWF|nr:Magnesium-chelatase subunit chlI chloroplastic [Tripterygium wilfordii]